MPLFSDVMAHIQAESHLQYRLDGKTVLSDSYLLPGEQLKWSEHTPKNFKLMI